MIYGRDRERAQLVEALERARAGRSTALVLRGEPGIGKSVLLDAVADAAVTDAAVTDAAVADAPRAGDNTRVLRVTGVEAEIELPFAALHALLRPALGRLPALPEAQAAALRSALGLLADAVPDRFLVGLAVLTLLAELGGSGPVVCLVDDAQWLDPASAEALVFAARRLDAEGIAMIFAAREGDRPFPAPGVPELMLSGLDTEAGRALLAGTGAELAPQARDRILCEAAGNPLALLEFARMLPPEQRDGALAPLGLHTDTLPVTGRVEQAYRSRIRALPESTRQLLLIAAAEDGGDLALVLRAAATCTGSGSRTGPADLGPAEEAGLVHTSGTAFAFRHPLVKAAAYRSATLAARVTAHRALAKALEPEGSSESGGDEADLRAWHLAAASLGPDEEVGVALRRAGDRAIRRGGHASAAAAYERAGQLTVDRAVRADRLAAAAEAAVACGQPQRAEALALRGARLTREPEVTARLAAVRGAVAIERGGRDGASPEATRGLIDAAVPILAVRPATAASMLGTAASHAWFAGDGALLAEAARRLEEAVLPDRSPLRRVPVAVAGLDRLLRGDIEAGLRLLREATPPVGDAPVGDTVAITFAVFGGLMTGDDERTAALATAFVQTCRERGLVGLLPHALQLLTQGQLLAGEHGAASVGAAEALRVAEETGQAHRLLHLRGVVARLAAVEGDDERCVRFAREAADTAIAPGASWAACALGLLDLGRARYGAAADRLEQLLDGPLHHTSIATFAIADFVEAAARDGRPERAQQASLRFERWAAAAGRPWAEAVVHRCRALLGPAHEAEHHFTSAVALHARGGRIFESARTRLLFGEWLRRGRRRAEARAMLHAALADLDRLGAVPWAERARAELAATGDSPAAPGPRRGPLDLLTPQELQVVRLAAAGATNREIAAQLFLSPRTVGFHLYKAFPKLGISSRADLATLRTDLA